MIGVQICLIFTAQICLLFTVIASIYEKKHFHLSTDGIYKVHAKKLLNEIKRFQKLKIAAIIASDKLYPVIDLIDYAIA